MSGATDRLAALPAAERAVCLAARREIDPGAAARLAATMAGEADWDRLWTVGNLHEVIALLAVSLPSALGPDVPGAWLARATRRRHVTLRSNARLAEALLPTLDALDAAGLPVMPVKGLALTERLYGDLSSRPCADIDILVRRADLAAARDVLRGLGFRQGSRPTYTELVHQFHDRGWVRGDGPEQVRLELHWALWADSDRRLGVDGLWERAVPGTLLGRPILALSLEDTLVHLAIHRTRSALRLRWLVDIAELVRRHGDDLDWVAIERRATSAGARTASWVALSLVRDLLGAAVPGDVTTALQVAAPKRVILERTCGVTALFRPAGDDLRQQPHLGYRAFEEDGVGRIVASLRRSALRPVRQALHESGIRPVRQPLGGG